MNNILLLLLFAIPIICAHHNTNQYEHRSVIVHMFEWKFSDIALECERWLGPKEYGAIQLSPVNEHIIIPGRPWWERYQPISYKILTRSGDEKDLLNMTRRCNANGVRIYADVVLNHMAGENPPPVIGTANSYAYPENYDFPGVPYTKRHFNKPCEIQNWNNAFDIRNCQIAGLPDLNHTKIYVRETIIKFLNQLIDLGVAGFRIDSAKHMWPEDLEYIFTRLNDLNTDFGFLSKTRPFIYLEIVDFGSQPGDLGRWDYKHLGRITDFLIPGEIGRAFRGYNALKWLKNWGPQWIFLPSDLAIVFIDEHEIQRGYGLGGADVITQIEPKLYIMGNAFMLAHPHGTPRIISSYGFKDKQQGPPMDMFENIISPIIKGDDRCHSAWNCEHRWKQIANMVKFRNEVYGTRLNNWWDNGNKQIAFSRGDRGFVAWNSEKYDLSDYIQTCLPSGVYCDVISGDNVNGACSGKTVIVDDDGIAHILVSSDSNDGVIAIHTGSNLEKICQRKTLSKIVSMYWKTACYEYNYMYK